MLKDWVAQEMLHLAGSRRICLCGGAVHPDIAMPAVCVQCPVTPASLLACEPHPDVVLVPKRGGTAVCIDSSKGPDDDGIVFSSVMVPLLVSAPKLTSIGFIGTFLASEGGRMCVGVSIRMNLRTPITVFAQSKGSAALRQVLCGPHPLLVICNCTW